MSGRVPSDFGGGGQGSDRTAPRLLAVEHRSQRPGIFLSLRARAVPHWVFFRSNQIVANVGASPAQNSICGNILSSQGIWAISSAHSMAQAAWASTMPPAAAYQ